jgi:hypothetical protein
MESLLQKKAMSRGLLWLDENVQFLEDLLFKTLELKLFLQVQKMNK